MSVFKSKINSDLRSQLIVMAGGLVICAILSGNRTGLAILIYSLTVVSIYFLLKTKYAIDKNTLSIKSGFLVQESVGIKQILSIKEIEKPRNKFSLFPDKLEIQCKRSIKVLVSPADKFGFIKELCNLNPHIEVSLKTG